MPILPDRFQSVSLANGICSSLVGVVLCATSWSGLALAAEPVRLTVDASDLTHRVFQVDATFPVSPGPLTLYYPQWIPGNHGPTGPIGELAGLQFFANGKPLSWLRDPLNIFAFKLDVPPGVSTLNAHYQFLSPLSSNIGRIVETGEILGLQWHTVALYPAGQSSDEVTVAANLTLPAGWQFASALEVASSNGATIAFKPTTLTNLIDSPVFAGQYVKKVDWSPDGKVPVTLNLFADAPDSLAIESGQTEIGQRLVGQAYKLFGPPHYQHYDFLVAMSNHFGHIGLEHAQSTEIGVRPDLLTKWKSTPGQRTVLAHEFAHAWNGKFRRPQDLATPHFNVPMQNSLLWVYEGQTTYWSNILSARSGLLTQEEAREEWALEVAHMGLRAGRAWRSLRDTTMEPVIGHRRSQNWGSWQRSGDYYPEGAMLWLEVDAKLRELTGEKRSLDQFAQAFFGVPGAALQPVTYTFANVVSALNGVAPFDWARFLNTRLDGHGPEILTAGLKNSGWKLVFTDKPNELARSGPQERTEADFTFSLGFSVGKGDQIASVIWDSPAFKAGLSGATTLVAVNGIAYQAELLRQALVNAQKQPQAIELLVRTEDRYRTVKVDYHDGLRYPHLERLSGTPDRLTAILTAVK